MRREVPLSIHEIIELMSKRKEYLEVGRISRHFVYDFFHRRKNVVCCNPAKITSRSRSSDVTDKDTEDFIAELSPLLDGVL